MGGLLSVSVFLQLVQLRSMDQFNDVQAWVVLLRQKRHRLIRACLDEWVACSAPPHDSASRQAAFFGRSIPSNMPNNTALFAWDNGGGQGPELCLC